MPKRRCKPVVSDIYTHELSHGMSTINNNGAGVQLKEAFEAAELLMLPFDTLVSDTSAASP